MAPGTWALGTLALTTRNTAQGTRNTEHGTRNTEPGTRNLPACRLTHQIQKNLRAGGPRTTS